MSEMTPREIVSELNRHIIGQNDAKKAVALALRNRWRRMNVDESIRQEITPKNILMIGPTGVGKTEIARRLAKLANAPFIKVEATKFTEVGYVGKEVDSIIRDLAEMAVKMMKETQIKKNMNKAQDLAEERILDVLIPAPKEGWGTEDTSSTRQILRKQLREGKLDKRDIEISVNGPKIGVEILGPSGMEDMTSQLQGMFEGLGAQNKQTKKMSVKDAMKVLTEEEAEKLIKNEVLTKDAIELVENNGIVFIDEIDKITAKGGESRGPDVSREGVQRDLLPLIEGCQVKTKYGMVKTDHILFITSGAFAVELKALTADDFERILVEPHASLTEQYKALLATEGLEVEFTDEAIRSIAQSAFQVNESTENIGARRLHTVMEKLCEDISFNAPDMAEKKITIDGQYVKEHLGKLVEDEDLSRYIL